MTAMVTAPHADAARVGAAVLSEGGCAADAAVAVASALAVLYPHMTGIGGDAFWLYYDAPSRRTYAYNGSGAAAGLATVPYYAERGCASVPLRGPLAALTVPGAVDAWFGLHDRFGRTDMQRLLGPAIAYAREGMQPASSVGRSLAEERSWLERDPGAAATFLRGRSAERDLVQLALAQTLEQIVSRGRAWFYEGEAAERISAWAATAGSPLRAEDLAEHHGLVVDPLVAPFGGLRSCTTPPNSQGITLLMAQRILDARFGEAYPPPDSAELIDAAVDALRIAYGERDRFVGDPRFTTTPVADLLSAQRAQVWAGATSGTTAGEPIANADGDTTYFACVDADGNAASFIQSLYLHFGAAVTVPDLGITLQNRGVAFTLDEGTPRSLVPGKRPFHTLMPAMLLRGDGKPALVYGSMGGDAQPQIALQLSLRIARFGEDPQDSIAAPRWRWQSDATGQKHKRSRLGRLLVESRMERAVVAQLEGLGHDIAELGEWEESMGHAGAIVIDQGSGALLGGYDPRSDGAAIRS